MIFGKQVIFGTRNEVMEMQHAPQGWFAPFFFHFLNDVMIYKIMSFLRLMHTMTMTLMLWKWL